MSKTRSESQEVDLYRFFIFKWIVAALGNGFTLTLCVFYSKKTFIFTSWVWLSYIHLMANPVVYLTVMRAFPSSSGFSTDICRIYPNGSLLNTVREKIYLECNWSYFSLNEMHVSIYMVKLEPFIEWVLNKFRLMFGNLNLILEVIGKYSVTWIK